MAEAVLEAPTEEVVADAAPAEAGVDAAPEAGAGDPDVSHRGLAGVVVGPAGGLAGHGHHRRAHVVERQPRRQRLAALG